MIRGVSQKLSWPTSLGRRLAISQARQSLLDLGDRDGAVEGLCTGWLVGRRPGGWADMARSGRTEVGMVRLPGGVTGQGGREAAMLGIESLPEGLVIAAQLTQEDGGLPLSMLATLAAQNSNVPPRQHTTGAAVPRTRTVPVPKAPLNTYTYTLACSNALGTAKEGRPEVADCLRICW